MKKIIYGILQRVVKCALYLYFNKIEINGKVHIPNIDEPFIYAPNHQSAFMDALIVGGLSSIPVHYLTRADIFKKPFLWILDALNMIPIYRIRDGYKNLSNNDAVFESCFKLLSQNKPILIFPEGNHGREYYLRPLTKGTARLALEAQKNLQKPLKIIPVGINMFRHDHPRHKLILNYGKPILVEKYSEDYLVSKPRTLNLLRQNLSDAIEYTLVIPRKTAQYQTQKNLFTRANEKLSFAQLKKATTNPPTNDQKYYNGIKPLIHILILPNLLAFAISYYILNFVAEEPVFRASMKLAIGIFFFPIFWILSFLIISLLWTFSMALLVLALQLISLFVRQTLARYTR